MSTLDKDAEIAFLKQKLADKDEMIRDFMRTEEHLTPLPNGDLHRGFKTNPARANIDVEVIPDNAGNPLDRAISNILKSAKIGNKHELTCLWCGMQWAQTQVKEVREHLKESHKDIVTGWQDKNAEILMANLQEANARLEAANV